MFSGSGIFCTAYDAFRRERTLPSKHYHAVGFLNATFAFPLRCIILLFFKKIVMYTNVWLKYLPVLRIVLKRSLAAEQQLALNAPDFGRAGYTRKSGYKFLLKIKDARLSNVIVDMPVASTLATALLDDKAIRELLLANEFHISLNTKYELSVKHIPQYKAHEEVATAEAV